MKTLKGCAIFAAIGLFILFAAMRGTTHKLQEEAHKQIAAEPAPADQEKERQRILHDRQVARHDAAVKHCKGRTGTRRTRDLECLFLDCPGLSQDAYDAALRGEVAVGMNQCMVLEVWGHPEDINRTTTAFGTTAQWVYGLRRYVYFDGDIVTAIQD